MSGFFQRLGEYAANAAPAAVSLLVAPRMEGSALTANDGFPPPITTGLESAVAGEGDFEESDQALAVEVRAQAPSLPPSVVEIERSEPKAQSIALPIDLPAEPRVASGPSSGDASNFNAPTPVAQHSEVLHDPLQDSRYGARETSARPPDTINASMPAKGRQESPMSVNDISITTERVVRRRKKAGADPAPSVSRRLSSSSDLADPVNHDDGGAIDRIGQTSAGPFESRAVKPVAGGDRSSQVSEPGTNQRDAPAIPRSPQTPAPLPIQRNESFPLRNPIEVRMRDAIAGIEIPKPRSVAQAALESPLQPLAAAPTSGNKKVNSPSQILALETSIQAVGSKQPRERSLEPGLPVEDSRKPASQSPSMPARTPSEAPVVRAADLMGIAESLWAENLRESQTILPAPVKTSERGAAENAGIGREPDTIHVTIGRVIVRAPVQTAPARPVAPASGISLKDYLERRSGGRP